MSCFINFGNSDDERRSFSAMGKIIAAVDGRVSSALMLVALGLFPFFDKMEINVIVEFIDFLLAV